MTIFSQTVTLISSLAWPAMIGAALIYFRRDMKLLISRLQSVGKEGAQFAPVAPQKDIKTIGDTNSPAGQLSDTPRDTISSLAQHWPPAYRPLIEEMAPKMQNIIDRELENDCPEVRRKLAEYTADVVAALLLERVYVVIFGSQLSAIEYIILRGDSAPKQEIQLFYDQGVRNYPQVYFNYSFEQWLDFLRNSGLVEVADDKVTIRPLGRALIPYILLRAYTKAKAG